MVLTFTKDSNHLISLFFGKSFTTCNNIPYFKTPKFQNKNTKLILTMLYNDIQDANDKKIPNAVISKINSEQEIPKPKSFSATSFPQDIRMHINSHSNYSITYSSSLNDRNIIVNFIVEDANPRVEIYNHYVQRIMCVLRVLMKMSNNMKCAKTLTLFIYMTSKQKTLPSNSIHVLDELNVNTAFSYSCPRNAEIVIFRKEEWFKVMIHELFHTLGLDFSASSASINSICNKEILNNLFPLPIKELNLFEAYTECWSRILNIVFAVATDATSLSEFLDNFNKWIHLEQIYSGFQMVKVLDFMGMEYKDLYSSSLKSRLAREQLYKENTSVFSYYVMTFLLLQDYESFMDWCSRHNSFSLFQFEITNENVIGFCKLIGRNYKSKSVAVLVECMQEAMAEYKKNSKTHLINNTSSILLNNTRMTIFELN